MGGKSGSRPAAASAARWPGVLGAVGLFLLVWLSCWYFKQSLLQWVATPLINAWPRDLYSPNYLYYEDRADVFAAYVRLCTIPALIAALPLLTRATVFRQRVPAAAFIGLSYAATAVALLNVRFSLVPPLLQWLVSVARGWQAAGNGIYCGSFFHEYVRVAANLCAAQALGAQLAVVLFYSTMIRRARGESWLEPELRLFGLSGGALLVGALLTPVDARSHPRFSLPLIALYVLATFAGRVVGRTSPRDI